MLRRRFLAAIQASPVARRERSLAAGANRGGRLCDLAVGDAVLKVDFLDARQQVLIRQTQAIAQQRPNRHVLEQHSIEPVFQVTHALLKVGCLSRGLARAILRVTDATFLMQIPQQVEQGKPPK